MKGNIFCFRRGGKSTTEILAEQAARKNRKIEQRIKKRNRA